MATYLAIIDEEQMCPDCQKPVGPGLVSVTDEIGPGKIGPVCGDCFHDLDPRLYVILRLSKGYTRPLHHMLDGASIVENLREWMRPDGS